MARGFTLIELLIVMAIVALLAAIAYPSYQNQVRKSRRSDGHIALTTAAQQLERCYTINGVYNQPAGCNALAADGTLAAGLATSQEGNYTVVANPLTQTTFVLTATPAGDQAAVGDPECGNLSLNQQGLRGESGTGTIADCW